VSEEDEDEEGKFWRVFSFEQAKRQKSGHRFPMSKLARKSKAFANILQLMATEIKTTVQFDFNDTMKNVTMYLIKKMSHVIITHVISIH
jgi:hypothetical protein